MYPDQIYVELRGSPEQIYSYKNSLEQILPLVGVKPKLGKFFAIIVAASLVLGKTDLKQLSLFMQRDLVKFNGTLNMLIE